MYIRNSGRISVLTIHSSLVSTAATINLSRRFSPLHFRTALAATTFCTIRQSFVAIAQRTTVKIKTPTDDHYWLISRTCFSHFYRGEEEEGKNVRNIRESVEGFKLNLWRLTVVERGENYYYIVNIYKKYYTWGTIRHSVTTTAFLTQGIPDEEEE